MNDDSKFDFSRPNIDDSTLDRHLQSLPVLAPYPGFEDRVMSRVLVPPPPWVRNMKLRVRSLVETRRFRWIAAGLMTTSTISLVVVTTIVLSNFSLDFFAHLGPLMLSRGGALIAASAIVGFLAFSAGMLACLMSPKCLARSE